MSGGSYNYIYSRVDEECAGRMFDREMNDMMKDIARVLKDLEWWQSGDSGEERYRETVKAFKVKWFLTDPSNRRTEYINSAVEELRKELVAEFGESEE